MPAPCTLATAEAPFTGAAASTCCTSLPLTRQRSHLPFPNRIQPARCEPHMASQHFTVHAKGRHSYRSNPAMALRMAWPVLNCTWIRIQLNSVGTSCPLWCQTCCNHTSSPNTGRTHVQGDRLPTDTSRGPLKQGFSMGRRHSQVIECVMDMWRVAVVKALADPTRIQTDTILGTTLRSAHQ